MLQKKNRQKKVTWVSFSGSPQLSPKSTTKTNNHNQQPQPTTNNNQSNNTTTTNNQQYILMSTTPGKKEGLVDRVSGCGEGVDGLPDSVLLNIFSFLDEESFLKTLLVCKKWNELVQKNIVFFEEWFAKRDESEEDDDEDGNGEPIEEDHQRVLIEQIVKCEERNYCHLFGIDATDDRQLSDEMEKEARTQYRRFVLLLDLRGGILLLYNFWHTFLSLIESMFL